jgi:hypothetical protein
MKRRAASVREWHKAAQSSISMIFVTGSMALRRRSDDCVPAAAFEFVTNLPTTAHAQRARQMQKLAGLSP